MMSIPQATLTNIEAFVTSGEAREAVESIRRQIPSDGSIGVHSGTLATAARLVNLTALGDVLIAELSAESHEANLAMVRDLSAEGIQLILLGRENKIELYRSFVAAGARDYLVLPLEDGVEVSINLDVKIPERAPDVIRSRCIGVCGVSGGVGASVLSANLAVAYQDYARSGLLARDTAGSVALIDADILFGTLAVDLDIDPTPGLLDALLAPARVDRTFLNATMAEPLSGLSVYSAEARESARIRSCEAGLPALLQRINASFPTLVVDLPRTLIADSPALIDEFDELILVLGPGFGGVRSCSRLLHWIERRPAGPRVTCVLSQTKRDAGLRNSEIAKALDRAIDMVLPANGAELARASVKGVPLQKMAPRSRYARAVAKLVAGLESSPDGPGDVKKSLWRRRTARDV